MPNVKGLWPVVRDALGTLVSGIFASIFFSTDHIVYGLWCSFIGLAVAFDIPFQYYAQKRPKHRRQVWISYWFLLLAIAGWFVVWSYHISHPAESNLKPVPRLTIVFSTADAPTNRVELTNDFLVVTNFHHSDICGDLIVPKGLDEPYVKFKFGIRNDSPVTAQTIEVSILLSKEWLCFPDDGWMPGDPVKLSGQLEMQSWVCKPEALLPGAGVELPDIRVASFPEFQTNIFTPMAIRARAEDSSVEWRVFSVLFWPPSTNYPTIARPFVVFEPKLPNGLRHFSMSAETIKKYQH